MWAPTVLLVGSWWAEGAVVVLVVVAGVHVLPLLAMPQILGDVGMLVLVQLSVVAVGVGHSEPLPRGLACQNRPRLPVQPPRG
jgi:hypothetical protein